MNWEEVKLQNTSLRARDIFFIDNKNGWILCDNGLLFFTNNNGGIVVNVGSDFCIDQKDECDLEQNYPNPFNPNTTIKYKILRDGKVTLKIFDFLGKEVLTLVNEEKPAGSYQVNFNLNRRGINKSLSSGIYFANLLSGGSSKTIKLILLK